MYGILIREGQASDGGKNIGDYIQSIAQRQFLHNKETRFVEIEKLSDFQSDESVNVIMNGWFMWDCTKFPPPRCINPLFVSFHLTPPKENDFFTKQTIAYLKRYQPIGCRDIKTVELMRKYGIDSYMSGCLTMTLGIDYPPLQTHSGEIYIVDPYVELGGDKSNNRIVVYTKAIWHAIKYATKVIKLKRNGAHILWGSKFRYISSKLDQFIGLAAFYHLYSQRFDDEILMNAKYTSAIVDAGLSNEDKFLIAEQMLENYRNAKCVITSRLHVYFPCLAIGTKSIFVMPSEKTEEKDVLRYSGRLGGLDDVSTILELRDGKLNDKTTPLPQKISLFNFPENKDGYKNYSDSLIQSIKRFLSNNPT